MDRLDPDQAVFLLRSLGTLPGAALGSREALIAYTLLHTLCHYWPSRATDEYRALLRDFSYLKHEESSRFIKQRRILLKMLLRKFDVDDDLTTTELLRADSPSPQTPHHLASK